jgi:signal transduction histidine kinase
MAASILEPFRSRIQERQQILQLQIPPELPPLVSDLTSVERIVSELVNNACKYTPPEEQITVTVYAKENTLQLRVSNSGVEIPQKELSRIFEKFYRIPSSDRWKQGGTGLGLALVQRLTEHWEVLCEWKVLIIKQLYRRVTFNIS